MHVLVSDTSVLVDLERGSLLEASFRLPFRFVVPDLLYERELKNWGGEELIRLGLAVEELDGDGVTTRSSPTGGGCLRSPFLIASSLCSRKPGPGFC